MRMYIQKNSTPRAILAAVLALIMSSGAFAAGQHSGGHGHDSGSQMGGHGHDADGHGHGAGANIGQPGKASEVSRTISVTMTDNRYSRERIEVKKGETVRFRIRNEGNFVHEFNIGTAAMHKAHQKEMAMMFEHGVLEVDKIHYDKMKMKMPDGHTMEHNDPNSVLLEPGKSAEIIWKFNADTTLEFACNMPGHYESGMVGEIKLR